MATCIVKNIDTDQIVNFIIASPTDLPPEGCYLVEIPEDCYWDDTEQIIKIKPVTLPEIIMEE